MVLQYRHLRVGAAVAALAFASVAAQPAAAQLLNKATTTAGPVKPYYGNLRPFYGNLRPFYGNLRPFYGNLRPFWGNLRPFWGDTSAFYGDLKAFWAVDNPVVGASPVAYAKVGDFWTKSGDDWAGAFATLSTSTPDYGLAAIKLNTIYADSATFWGVAVQAKTGKSFEDGFLKPFLAKHGIDPTDPASYSKLDQSKLAYLFLEYYDALMDYTGTDHVDHWMRTINWSPALARTQGAGGAGVTIGILDQTVIGAETAMGQVIQFHGTSDFTDGHGAAVGSLLVGAHDGAGVMGMAPNAKVFAYNPFDDTGTADWADVTKGVRMLKASQASVVNMSLGVPGTTFDQGWNGVFSDLSTTLILKNTVFVIAAGNDGVTQTKNVNWSPINPAFLLVGSVDVEGKISNFSNRPGEACLTTLFLCLPGQKLKDRFIVAPGELILVSDGQGGTTRQIGTSFAAPLVSGAIAMLHDRWPWLKNFPGETVDVILRSAKDLGAPGTDPVYGRGLLDVEASQSPLNFNSLFWYTVENGKMAKMQTAGAVVATYQAEQQKTWDAQGAYFYAFEPLGLLTQRDFAIPLSQKLVGQRVTTAKGATEQFQAYMLERMGDWVRTKTGTFAFGGANAFSSGNATAIPNPFGVNMTTSFAPRHARFGFNDEGPAYQSAFQIRGERSAVTFGFGDGAPALSEQTGFTRGADYDVDRGGANPLLGLASGGGYAGWSYSLTDRVQITAGALMREEERDRRLLPALGVVGNGAERYGAEAQHLSVSYQPADGLTLTGAYTRLHEGSGLLGTQSFDPTDFRDGSTTDGYSASLNWALGGKLSLMATGTMGKTRQSGDGQAFKVDGRGLTSSSFAVGLARTDLFKAGDRLQMTISQPMFVERGRLNIDTVQVIDRETGQLGVVSQGVDIAGKRRIAAEALYMAPIQAGQGDVALFGRAETGAEGTSRESYVTGARYRIAF